METHNSKRETCSVSEPLGDTGNCKQDINQELNLHLFSDSLFSEQQKLRHVLDWAHRVLSSGSEVYQEFCRADILILSVDKDEKKRETEESSPAYKHSSAATDHRSVSCPASSSDVFEGGRWKVWQLKPPNYKNSEQNHFLCAYKPPLQDDLHIPLFFTPDRDEVTWPENRETEIMKSKEMQHTTNKKTPRQDNCGTSTLQMSYQRHQANKSGSSANQTLASDAGTCLNKESTLCWSNAMCKNSKAFGAVSTRNPLLQSSNSRDITYKTAVAQSKGEMSEVQKEPIIEAEGMAGVKKEKIGARLGGNDGKMRKECESSSVFTVYTNGNMRHTEPVLIPGQRADPQAAKTANPSFTCRLKIPSNLTVYEQYQLCVDRLHNLRMSRSQHIKNGRKTPKETAAPVEASCFEFNSSTTNPDNLKHFNKARSKRVRATEERCSEGINKNQDKTTYKRYGVTLIERAEIRCCDDLTVKKSRPLCQKNTVKVYKQVDFMRRTAEVMTSTDKGVYIPVKHLRAATDDVSSVEESAAFTPNSGSTAHIVVDNADCKYCPAGAPVSDSWLHLPDEVWLYILSLLPLSSLCRVLQVCSRLHRLATDHTLWKTLRVENSSLTEQWLLFVGRGCPRSLCLHNCSGPSVTSCGLETLFTLCRNSLEEVKVTSCTGPSLHGDQMLLLIGQLCDHVTSVDMSWSGATDTGVKALSDGCAGFRLKSLVLNGCHVTDDPLKKLIRRHKESLCRLEVFGCHLLTPSCLQTIYEMCPGLKHLNIGQVPKVNARSLTVLTSQLACLISLNLTGLQAVTNATVETLLQNCIRLQSLTLGSCPGVTNLTLHNISKYTPCIRSLDMSDCKAITDAGVQSLALGCRRLQQLDLSSTGAGNRGVTLLSNYCSMHLHTVKLNFCRITSESILKLCGRCKRLKVLHLYGCAGIPTEREIREVNTSVKVYPLPTTTCTQPIHTDIHRTSKSKT